MAQNLRSTLAVLRCRSSTKNPHIPKLNEEQHRNRKLVAQCH